MPYLMSEEIATEILKDIFSDIFRDDSEDMDSSVNLLADMVPSEDMLPSPSNTFEDEEDDDSV